MNPTTYIQVNAVDWGDPPWFEITIAAAIVLVLLLVLTTRRETFGSFWRGLQLGLGGLLGKELRSRSRGWRPMWLLTAYLALLTAGVAGFLNYMVSSSGTLSPTIGATVFTALAFVSVLLLAFITPALSVGAISGERERRTLDLLLVTRASALGLVAGKLLGSLLTIVYLLVASLPAFSLIFLFGGIPLQHLGMVFAVAFVTAAAHTTLGLLLSATLKRTIMASVLSYLVVIGVVLGAPIFSAFFGFTQSIQRAAAIRNPTVGFDGPVSPPPPAYTYVSPITALASVLPTDLTNRAFSRGESRKPPTPFHAVYVVGYDQQAKLPEVVIVFAPWLQHMLFAGIFTVFGVFASALAITPIKPWAIRRRAKASTPTPVRAT